MLLKRYASVGPVAEAYRASKAPTACIMGPVGSGKTSATIIKIFQNAMRQTPTEIIDHQTGEMRRESFYRVIALRNSYQDIWRGPIPSWRQWVKTEGEGVSFTGSEGRPATYRARLLNKAKDCVINFEAWFLAPGPDATAEDIENMFQGVEPTDGWLNEVNKVNPELRRQLFGRLGRYPNRDGVRAVNPQLLCDMNAPDAYNWTVEYFIENPPKSVAFFRQPGGREPNAENQKNWGRADYDRIAEANADDPDYVRRMIDNKIGKIRDGRPVYDELFDEARHVVPSHAAPALLGGSKMLVLGCDAGRKPAGVLGKRDLMGRLILVDEIWMDHAGPDKFARGLQALLDAKWPGYAIECAWVDPSADQPKETSRESEAGEAHTWAKIMAEIMGFPFRPAPGMNDLTVRIETLAVALSENPGGQPGLMISDACAMLRRGFAREYKYRKIQGDRNYYEDKPLKNDFSHLMEAAQYLALGTGGYESVMRKRKKPKPGARPASADRYDPLARHRRAS